MTSPSPPESVPSTHQHLYPSIDSISNSVDPVESLNPTDSVDSLDSLDSQNKSENHLQDNSAIRLDENYDTSLENGVQSQNDKTNSVSSFSSPISLGNRDNASNSKRPQELEKQLKRLSLPGSGDGSIYFTTKYYLIKTTSLLKTKYLVLKIGKDM